MGDDGDLENVLHLPTPNLAPKKFPKMPAVVAAQSDVPDNAAKNPHGAPEVAPGQLPDGVLRRQPVSIGAASLSHKTGINIRRLVKMRDDPPPTLHHRCPGFEEFD